MSGRMPSGLCHSGQLLARHGHGNAESPIHRAARGAKVLVVGSPRKEGQPLYEEVPYQARYFKNGLYGFIELYSLGFGDIEYMDASSLHGFEIIFKVTK